MGRVVPKCSEQIPRMGYLERPPLNENEEVYAMRQSLLGVWAKARVSSIKEIDKERQYNIKFETTYKKSAQTKWLSGKYLAYAEPSRIRLAVSINCIKFFQVFVVKNY